MPIYKPTHIYNKYFCHIDKFISFREWGEGRRKIYFYGCNVIVIILRPKWLIVAAFCHGYVALSSCFWLSTFSFYDFRSFVGATFVALVLFNDNFEVADMYVFGCVKYIYVCCF